VFEQAEMAVDIACRTALAQRGVSHLTIPIDVQEKKLSGKYSRHNVEVCSKPISLMKIANLKKLAL
jgi:thiamine pyrophosphate-dependent acetolactate synthase large subunit-like protein